MRIEFLPAKSEVKYDSSRLTYGKYYLVVGVSILNQSGFSETIFNVKDDVNGISLIRSECSKIVDSTPFSEWVIRSNMEGVVSIFPKEFFDVDWMDEVFEFSDPAYSEFLEICNRAEE